MQDAAFAAIQRTKVKRRVRLANTFGSGCRAHAKLLDAQRASIVRVETQFRVIVRRHVQRFLRQVLQREQHFGFVRQKQIDVRSRELHHHFGIFEIRMWCLAFGHDVFHVEVGGIQYGLKKVFNQRAGFGHSIFFVGQVQLLPFLLLGITLTAAGGGEMRFSAHCMATATTLPVNQYSTNPADAK